MDNAKPGNLNFEDIYSCLHLNTIHRWFSGTDSSLIAVFYLFEFLHNFKGLADYADKKEEGKKYAMQFYENYFKRFAEWENESIVSCKPVNKDYIGSYARPEVYNYVFGKKWISKKKKKKILFDAKTEFLNILNGTGIKRFAESALNHEKNL